MHMQPLFSDAKCFSHFDDRYFDENVFARAVCLPSGDGMSDKQTAEVAAEIKKCFE
jgi:pyridoxal phosphate-dependent aminotransferase EpsN